MDILMQNNRLPMVNGDFQLVSGVDEIKQHVIVALNTFFGDWILDFEKGIDYAYGFRHDEFLEYDIKNQLSGIDGVLSVDDLNMEYDKENLVMKVTASLNTTYGRLDVRNTINRG